MAAMCEADLYFSCVVITYLCEMCEELICMSAVWGAYVYI
jgi:hypothetical protein